MCENGNKRVVVGRVPSPGVPALTPAQPPPRRLRRLHRVWPDKDGNISYLLTLCIEERHRVLDNEVTFEPLVNFLLDSPKRYGWFARRFVIMPDHLHLVAHMGHEAMRLGQWAKALKAVVGGLQRRQVNSDPAESAPIANVGLHEFSRIPRKWRWQEGFHDYKFRTPESESRKWEYICLNPVRAGLVTKPEAWPYGGEIFYDPNGTTELKRGTPPLLASGLLIEEK